MYVNQPNRKYESTVKMCSKLTTAVKAKRHKKRAYDKGWVYIYHGLIPSSVPSWHVIGLT
jgi:hypothetical protein